MTTSEGPEGRVRVPAGFAREFPGADPRCAEAAANLVRTTSSYLAELDRRRRPIAALSASAYQTLAILEGAGQPLPSSVIADRLLVTTASMTSLLDTLERRGLVVRSPHPHDRRKILVELTNDAYQVVDQMLPVVHRTATDVFSVLTPDERTLLIDLLARAHQRLEEVRQQAPPDAPPRRRPRRRS